MGISKKEIELTMLSRKFGLRTSRSGFNSNQYHMYYCGEYGLSSGFCSQLCAGDMSYNGIKKFLKENEAELTKQFHNRQKTHNYNPDANEWNWRKK